MFATALLAIFNFQKIVDKVESSIALAAFVGIALLVPLFLSQRRDIRRLVAFREAEPIYPGADLAASEALLDRAEAELEKIYAGRGIDFTREHPAVSGTEIQPDGLPFGDTTERPALSQRTTELAALEPHPRWKRVRSRVTRPAWLAAIAVGAALLAIGVVVGSEKLSDNSDDSAPAKSSSSSGFDQSTVTVSVLNGTSQIGLASKVSSDVTADGYERGEIGNLSATGDFPKTVVYFQPKDKASEQAARRVSKLLGKAPIQEITPEAQKLAGDADVVVVAGDDRAG
jgi:hypothetical protein